MNDIYLDNAATTRVASEVRAAVLPFLEDSFGNPSSRHPVGARAAAAVDDARRAVATALGARPEDVVFTAGGTEANNLAVLGLARARKRHGRHVLIGPTEHPSVRAAAFALRDEGFDVEVLLLDEGGELDVDDLARRVREDTVLVAQMMTNNEFGTIYPVDRVARIVRANAPRAAVHVDAVQAIGKVELSLGETGAHSLAISAHKIHGLKGTGALVLTPDAKPRPLVFGGGQERGLRSGTENVAGIVALGVATRMAVEHVRATAGQPATLRERLRTELARVDGARLLDPGRLRSPAIAAILLPGAPAEVWMHHLEERGIYTSVGSACQAKAKEVPPGLRALGLDDDEARRVLRMSFARDTREDEVVAAVDALVEIERTLGVVS